MSKDQKNCAHCGRVYDIEYLYPHNRITICEKLCYSNGGAIVSNTVYFCEKHRHKGGRFKIQIHVEKHTDTYGSWSEHNTKKEIKIKHASKIRRWHNWDI